MAQVVEQREARRIKYPLKVYCIAEYQVFETRLKDFSLSGACLWSPVEFSPGKSLGLIVRLPGVRRFYVIPAEVVWTQGSEQKSSDCRYQVGVKYLYLLPDLAKNFQVLFRVLK